MCVCVCVCVSGGIIRVLTYMADRAQPPREEGTKAQHAPSPLGHVSFLFCWRKRLTLISAEYTYDFVFRLYKLQHLCAMTTDSSVTPPNEREKPTAVDVENVNSDKVAPTATVDAERSALLASLPDPDAGKTDEERREIVS
jgi:hypothetical protein